MQQPCQALLDYASTIQLNAKHCAYPDSIVNQAMHVVFAAGVSTEATKLLQWLVRS